jgi:hypothetical protein
MALVSIRERCERALLRSFLNRWRNNVIGRRELWNKRRAALRFLIALMDARARAIMSSKFANWKRVLQVNVDEVLAKFRTLIEMLTRYSNNVIRPTKKDFLNRVSRFTNPNYQTKVLKKLFKNYNVSQKRLLQKYVNKWKNQALLDEVQRLKRKLLQVAISNVVYGGDKKDRIRALHRWNYIARTQKLLENQGKEVGDKLKTVNSSLKNTTIRNLINHLERGKNKRGITRSLGKWRDIIRVLVEKTKEQNNVVIQNYIIDAKKHMLKHNINKNAEDLFKRLKVKDLLMRRRVLLNYLLRKNKDFTNKILRDYVQRWRDVIRASRQLDTENEYKNRMIVLGVKQLKKALEKKPWRRFKRIVDMLNLKIPWGVSVVEALIKYNRYIAQAIAVRNLQTRPIFKKWKKKVDDMKRMDFLRDIFLKLLRGPVNSIDTRVLRKYVNKWRDNIGKLRERELRKNLHLRILTSITGNKKTAFLKKYLNDWKKTSDYIGQQIKDTENATNLLRKAATQPVINQIKTSLLGQNKFDRVRAILINRLRNNDRDNMSYILQKWNKIAKILKDNDIKLRLLNEILKNRTLKNKFKGMDKLKNNYNSIKNKDLRNKILKIIANHNDLRIANDDNYKKLRALLHWRINAAPDQSFDKVKNIREGAETLIQIFRNKYNKDVFDGINNRSRSRGGKLLLLKLLSKLDPKFEKYILKKAIQTWKDNLGERVDPIEFLRNLFDDYLNTEKIHNKMYEPYKDLVNTMKTYHEQKIYAGRVIADFCKDLTDVQNQMRKMDRLLLLNDILIRNSLADRAVLRTTLTDWNRRTRYVKAEKDAKTIQDFVRKKLIRLGDMRDKLANGIKHIKHYIFRMFLKKFGDKGENDRIYQLLRKFVLGKDAMNRKILQKYFHRWRDIIPLLRRIDCATTIQSTYRGYKTRQFYDKLRNRLTRLRDLIIKMSGKKDNILRPAFAKWLKQIQKMKVKENAKIIQKFCNFNLDKYLKDTASKKLYDILRKYIIKQITDLIKSIAYNSALENFKKTILKIYFNKLMNDMKKKIIMDRIKWLFVKIVNNLDGTLSDMVLRRAINIWNQNAKKIGDNEYDSTLLVQSQIRKFLARKRFENMKMKKNKLTNILQRLINKYNKRLPVALLKWRNNVKNSKINDDVRKIQNYLRNLKKKIITKKTEETTVKYHNGLDSLKKIKPKTTDALNKLKNLTKFRIFTVIDDKLDKNKDYIKDAFENIKTHTLINSLRKAFPFFENSKKKIIKNIINKWIDNAKDIAKKNAITTIQSLVRGKQGRNKYKGLNDRQNIMEILIQKIIKLSDMRLPSAFQKWLRVVKKMNNDENARIIQIFCRKVNDKKTRDKENEINQKITDGLNVLINIGPKPDDAYNRLRNLIKFKVFETIDDKLNKNKDLLKDVFKNIKTTAKENAIKRLIPLLDSKLRNITINIIKQWKDTSDDIKKNKAVDIIQRFLKGIKPKNVKKNKDKVNTILIDRITKLNDKEKLKLPIALTKWFRNTKKMGDKDHADKIKNFFKKIIIKNKKNKEETTKKKITKGLDTLKNIKPKPKDSIQKLKNLTKFIIFKIVNNKLDKNKDLLKDALKNIKDKAKEETLKKIFPITDKANDRVKENIISKWKDIIQKVKDIDDKKEKTNDLLINIFKRFDKRNALRVPLAIRQWLSNVKKQEPNKNANILINFFKKIPKKITDKKNKDKIERITKALEVLDTLKPDTKGPLNKLKFITRMKIFPKINDIIEKNRKEVIKDTWDAINKHIIDKLLRKLFPITENARKRILKNILTTWKDNADDVKKNDSATKIQSIIRMVISKNKVKDKLKRNDLLRRFISKLTEQNDKKVPIYLNKWKNTIVREKTDKNANKIHNFFNNVINKIREKDRKNRLERIKNGLDILEDLSPGLDTAFKKIKSTSNRIIFENFINSLDKKTKDIKKDVFDNIKKYGILSKLRKILDIPEEVRKRILKTFLNRWNNKAQKEKKLRSVQTIQKNYRIYINDKIKKRIQELLWNIHNRKDRKRDDILREGLQRWKNTINKEKLLENAKKNK